MPIIHVKEKCTFTDASGRRHDFAVGSHDVEDEIAAHSYVQAHCSGQPIPVLPADPAGALAALTAQVNYLTVERDALLSDVHTAGEHAISLQERIDALAAQVTDLTAERDALAAQVTDLGNQIAELQAGGDAPAAAAGKPKKG